MLIPTLASERRELLYAAQSCDLLPSDQQIYLLPLFHAYPIQTLHGQCARLPPVLPYAISALSSLTRL